MITYNTNEPITNDSSSEVFSEIRAMKTRFKERFEVDHNMDGEVDTSLQSADGYHKFMRLPSLLSDPASISLSKIFYCKNVNGVSELFFAYNQFVYQITETLNSKLRISAYKDAIVKHYSYTYTGNQTVTLYNYCVDSNGNIYWLYRLSSDTSNTYVSTVGNTWLIPGLAQNLCFFDGAFYVIVGTTIKGTTDFVTWTSYSTNAASIQTAGVLFFSKISGVWSHNVGGLEDPSVPMYSTYRTGLRFFKLSDGYYYLIGYDVTANQYRYEKYSLSNWVLSRVSTGVLGNPGSGCDIVYFSSDENSDACVFVTWDTASLLYKLFYFKNGTMTQILSSSSAISQPSIRKQVSNTEINYIYENKIYCSYDFGTPEIVEPTNYAVTMISVAYGKRWELFKQMPDYNSIVITYSKYRRIT